MTAPDKIWVNLDDNTDGCCPVETDLDDVGKFFDASQATEYTRSDLIQSAVAAALETAKDALNKMPRREERLGGQRTQYIQSHEAVETIAAMITPAQHDALAAHVAAEVAKARAEMEALVDAAHGLSFGEDWNKGNAALHYGYRQKLLAAIGAIKGKMASPQAIAAAIRALVAK